VRVALLVAVGGVLVVVVWLGSGIDFAPRKTKVSEVLAPAPVAVARGVYLLGRTSPGAVYAVETADGLVLIDSGLEASAASVTRQLDELGFNPRRIKAILLTHVHADHSLGANRLRELSGAQVYAGRADCAVLRKGGPREAFFSTFHMPHLAPHPTQVDVELAGDEVLEFGGDRFVALATPGHTPGSICYLLERPNLRALFTGDVVQTLSRTTGGDLGTYAAYLPPLYRGNARDYLASLRKLREMAVPDLVLPGHPRMDGQPQSPRLSEERWHALLDGGIAEMERLLARFKADGASFLDGNPKELLPGLHYLGNVGPAAVYCLDTGKGLFLFDAPGGPALVDLLAAQFRKRGWRDRKLTAVLLTAADRESTGGLEALLAHAGAGLQVVAPKAGLETVRPLCPAEKLRTEEDLAKAGWFDVEAIPLAGRGQAPLAYRLRWAGKTVLVSGRIPVKASVPALEGLRNAVGALANGPADYLRSLDRLAQEKPDLWLPAVPVHGQNANLYDQEWEKVLGQNRHLVAY
jgi:metallo-beta-lactamase class B